MRKVPVFALLVAGVVALTAPAQAYPCDRLVHVHTSHLHICVDPA